ncbi:MAG: hypothetical protein AAF517_21650, partial [Planctomycetota bacterium]
GGDHTRRISSPFAFRRRREVRSKALSRRKKPPLSADDLFVLANLRVMGSRTNRSSALSGGFFLRLSAFERTSRRLLNAKGLEMRLV